MKQSNQNTGERIFYPPKGPLLNRFSKHQRELAETISNDIAEGIDNGHSRQQLRMAVAYYADLAATAYTRECSKRTAELIESFKGYIANLKWRKKTCTKKSN